MFATTTHWFDVTTTWSSFILCINLKHSTMKCSSNFATSKNKKVHFFRSSREKPLKRGTLCLFFAKCIQWIFLEAGANYSPITISPILLLHNFQKLLIILYNL
jgi:hypothetical protein